jgi:DNA-binding CsgD family transcriptional regulator
MILKIKLQLEKFIVVSLMVSLLNIFNNEKMLAQLSVVCRSQPFIQNFTKGDYKGANQNWSITQDMNGILYFGNTYGLLEFNGADWQLHTHPEITYVRSVYADTDGKIYTGSFEEFGYWQRNSFGELYYTSLSKKFLDQEDISNISIWRILKIGKYLYLHSFSKIFVYDGKEIKIIKSDNTILPIFEYRGKPFVSILNSGLFSINEDLELVKEPVPDFISKLRILQIFEENNDTSIVFTEKNGIYLKIGKAFIESDAPDNLLLKNYQINRVLKINNHLYAIGTIKNGVLLTDHRGNIQSRLDKSNGLQNNTVLALWKDPNNNLWIGLDKGIDFTYITSPFYIITDQTGKLGAVYCSVLHNGRIYLGTNHGVYYADWNRLINRKNTEFIAVPGLDEHVLSLNMIDDQLICGFNQGTYIIEDNHIIRLSDIGGGSILKHPYLNNIGYQGIYTGIGLYKKDKSGIWRFSKVLKETNDTKFIQIDHDGNLWASSSFKGIQMHQLNNSGDSIIHTISFGKKDGFFSDYYINVFKLVNRLVFANGGSFYTYDYLTRKIVPFYWLNKQIGRYTSAHILYEADPSEFWFISRSSLCQFQYLYDSLALKYEIKYNSLHASAVEYSENITKIDEHYYVIGLDDGFAILDYRQTLGSLSESTLHTIRINSFLCFKKADVAQKVNISTTSNLQIPFRQNNFLVNYSVPGTTQNRFTFYYRFSDLEPWSDLGNTNVLRYNNLRSGSYMLEIKAVEEVSGRSTTVLFPFSILPPWYFHWSAIIAYVIVLFSLGLLVRKIIMIRLIRRQMKIHEKIRIENENRMVQMNQEYLRMELKNKSKELVNYTILLDKRTELLNRLKSMLSRELDDPKASPHLLKLKIIDFIDQNISNRNDWQIFKSHFDAANSEFLEKLKNMHHSLTPSDLRFCAFLRMNLTSKEISSLLSISLRSVEVKRYRLRKKLNLDHDKNLIEYLMNA